MVNTRDYGKFKKRRKGYEEGGEVEDENTAWADLTPKVPVKLKPGEHYTAYSDLIAGGGPKVSEAPLLASRERIKDESDV